jgi:hypothetical protein
MQQSKHMITAESRDICEEVFRLACLSPPDLTAIDEHNIRLVERRLAITPRILATQAMRRRAVWTINHLRQNIRNREMAAARGKEHAA